MLYYYPSNRLEFLADILSTLLSKNISSPLETPTVIIPHTGLQHWLSLYLARHQRLMMNIDFPLPTRYVWEQSREILGKDLVPRQSPYKREVLQWRIFDILTKKNQQPELDSLLSSFNISSEEHERIFELSVLLADIFEQYIVYRPDWLVDWEKGDTSKDIKDVENKHMLWQKALWQSLIQQNKNSPIALQKQAEKQFKQHSSNLPAHLYLFAVGSLPPQFTSFFFKLSEVIDVHFLVVNPCEIYWGDALSDKQISYLERKVSSFDITAERNLHPLLRNLGQQGKEFLHGIIQLEHIEIGAYDPLDDSPMTQLRALQQSILKSTSMCETMADNSISIHACYSAVRELQVLKDFLLEQLSNDKELQLDEILVLTPNIEDYAPFIETVFKDADSTLNLGVSISDRKPIESDPEVKSFMALLSLVNSRFSVSDVFAPLSSKALKKHYRLTSEDIDLIESWLNSSAVVWGKNQQHKQNELDTEELNDKHTWSSAIHRLVIGMCNPQGTFIADGIPVSDVIEGQQQQLLGKFLRYLDWLMEIDQKAQNITDIAQYVSLVTNALQKYEPVGIGEKAVGISIIENSLSRFYETYQLSEAQINIGFKSLHDAFMQSLSLPETKAKYLLGKITFCSMIPMRSVPFKVVAILGLNQDSFPRKSIRSELNLMDVTPRKHGDRSRKNDDRYLFLEAIISARKALYLSYQHKNIKDNSDRSPSLVLEELLEYIRFEIGESAVQINFHPMHPFDNANYITSAPNQHASFDPFWYRISRGILEKEKPVKSSRRSYKVEPSRIFDVSDISEFYFHPIKKTVKDSFGLTFPYAYKNEFEQPFILSVSDKRRLRSQILKLKKIDADASEYAAIKTHLIKSGDYADLTALDAFIELQIDLMDKLYEASKPHRHLKGVTNIDNCEVHYNMESDVEGRIVMCSLNDDVNIYDKIKMKINLLAASKELIQQEGNVVSGIIYFAKDTLKKPAVKMFEIKIDAESCEDKLNNLLKTYFAMLKHPKLLSLRLAEAFLDSIEKHGEDISKLEEIWKRAAQPADEQNRIGMANDVNYRFLFPSHPDFEMDLLAVYRETYFMLFEGNP